MFEKIYFANQEFNKIRQHNSTKACKQYILQF